MAIIDAGVQSSEDSPFLTPAYRFLPGDFVYATFQITNFASKQANSEAPPKISLKYAATLEDSNGLPMAAPESGTIDSELSAEDKNWTPKRRVSFTLPPFLAAGKAQVHIVVRDLLGSTEDTLRVPLSIGGVTVLKSDSVAVQNFQFFRREADTEALNIAAFSPGDTIFAKFDITGFRTDAQNTYRLVYDILVLRPDGKPFIQQPHAAELTASGLYPAQVLPAMLQLTTSATSTKGAYAVILTVHDLIGTMTTQTKTSFTIE